LTFGGSRSASSASLSRHAARAERSRHSRAPVTLDHRLPDQLIRDLIEDS
jgi:hypothetical protein